MYILASRQDYNSSLLESSELSAVPGEAPFCPFSTSNSNSPSLSSSCSSSSPSSSVCPLGSSGIGEKTVSCSPAGEVCVEVLNTDSIYQLTQETYTYQKAIYLVKSFEASAPFFFFLPDKDKVQHNSLSCSVGEMTPSLTWPVAPWHLGFGCETPPTVGDTVLHSPHTHACI